MKKSTLNLAFLLLGLGLLAGTALAGSKPPDPALFFYEQNNSGIAAGTMAGVRKGGNATDDIGCWHKVDQNGDNSGGCKVVSGNTTRTCNFDPLKFEFYATAVNNMTSHSQVYFAWNPQGVCTFLQVTNDSAYGPPAVN